MSANLLAILLGLATSVHAADQVVTNNNDSGAGSLRQAIIDVHDGGAITFDDDYTITLASNLPYISKSVTIIGRGCKQTVIDGAGLYQPFYVQSTGSLTLSHLTMRNAACIKNYGVLSLDGVDLHGNTGYAGAVQQASSGTGATIVNSAIYGNTATNRGGAIHATVGTVTIKNTTISGNVSEYYGGGVCAEGADIVLDSCTIANNSFSGSYGSSKGGGVVLMAGTLTIQNTILANNQQNDGANDYCYYTGGTLTDNGYNFVEVSNTSDATGFSNGVNNNIVGTDPTGLASSLSYEGGWTPILKITAGTFTGGNYGATAETRDQRGYHRKSTEITRGAYQYDGVVARRFFGAWDGGYPTIAAAIAAASEGDVINVIDTVVKETGVTIPKSHVIVGLTTDARIWGDDEAGTATGGIFEITGGSVLLQDITIQYGNSAAGGGGVSCAGATLELTNCVIAGNTSAADGGGICTGAGTSLKMSHCTVRNNTASGDTQGGGALVKGTVSITRSTFSNNAAKIAGGVLAYNANTVFQDCTFYGNVASYQCGGVYQFMGTCVFANCTIAGNQSPRPGGGILGSTAQTGLLNTIVVNNTGTGGADVQNDFGIAYAQNSWYDSAVGVTSIPVVSNVTTAYTAGDLLPLADNGGDTMTMSLALTSPAIGAGDFVYHNSNDGYYCQDANGDYRDAFCTQVTPANPAADKITTDQRGVTRASPVSIGACFTADPKPVVTTAAVSDVTSSSAACGGEVTDQGDDAVTARGVCWNTSGAPTTDDNTTSDGTGTGAFTSNVTGLSPGVTYYVRAYATNSYGTSYGAEEEFTADAAPPTITTNAVSDITTNSAVSGGQVTSDGGRTVTAGGVCWNTTGTPTTDDDKTVDLVLDDLPSLLVKGPDAFTSDLTGLSPGTTYYVRAYAVNKAGTGYGSELQFTTTGVKSTVTTANVSDITADGAVCGGEITSDGGAGVAARGVCWNTTGTPTVADDKTTDGTGTGAFSSTITGLDPDTTYYVRAYATNSAGVSYGDERTFATAAAGDGGPNLRVTVQAANQAANVGEEIGFTVNVRNLGDAAATNVRLRFPLPPNTNLIGVWLTGDQTAQSTPLDAYVDGDQIVVELGDISAAKGLALEVVLEAETSGQITLTASAACDEKPSQVTAQADTEVEVDDAYVEIIRTMTPLNPCGLMGFASPLLLMLSLATMKRRG